MAAGFQSFYEDSFGAEDVHSVPPLVARVVGAARNDNRAEPLYVDVLAKDVDELIILAESSRVANDHARLENQDRVAGDMELARHVLSCLNADRAMTLRQQIAKGFGIVGRAVADEPEAQRVDCLGGLDIEVGGGELGLDSPDLVRIRCGSLFRFRVWPAWRAGYKRQADRKRVDVDPKTSVTSAHLWQTIGTIRDG